jgi:internalin A
MEKPIQIFLSYAHLDKKIVADLYEKLTKEGFKPWMDTEDILPGENFRLAIEKGIRNSDFFLACLTKNSVDRRGFIQRELKEAHDLWKEKLDSDIYLIPVRLEECKAPENLQGFQWVDLFEPNGWARLLKAIQEGIRRRTN